MNYKAVFIDVDGTLLTDDHTILPGTKEVITRLVNQGMLVAIVTARSPTASLGFYEDLGIAGNPIICFNGALILAGDSILKDETIGSGDTSQVLETLQQFPVTTSLYKNRDWYANEVDHRIQRESDITHSTVTPINFKALNSQQLQPNKILCMGEPADISKAEKKLLEQSVGQLNIHLSKPTYLEIMSKNASKSRGIETVIAIHKINPAEIIAIGDNYNDIDMLQFAGTGIAMGNAPDPVKQSAAIITDNNNSEGIWKILNRLIP